METAQQIIESGIAGWQQQVEQLDARQRRLAAEIDQLEAQKQQHIGAIMGARDLLTLLPAEPAAAEAAAEAQATDKPPLDERLAVKIPQLIEDLSSAYLQMIEINEIWSANGMTDKIAAAAVAGETIAGYSPATWVTWGTVTPRIVGFLNTTYDVSLPDGTTRTETPRLALLRDYQKES